MKYYWIGMLIIWVLLLYSVIWLIVDDKRKLNKIVGIFPTKQIYEDKEIMYKDLEKMHEYTKRILMPLIVGCVASIINCVVQIILIGG